MDQCNHQINFSSLCRSVTYILWPSKFASCLEDYSRKVVLGMLDQCHSETDIMSLTLKYLIIKKWRRPGVFVTLWAFALVIIIIIIIIIILFIGSIKQRSNIIFLLFPVVRTTVNYADIVSKPEVDFQRARFVLIF